MIYDYSGVFFISQFIKYNKFVKKRNLAGTEHYNNVSSTLINVKTLDQRWTDVVSTLFACCECSKWLNILWTTEYINMFYC